METTEWHHLKSVSSPGMNQELCTCVHIASGQISFAWVITLSFINLAINKAFQSKTPDGLYFFFCFFFYKCQTFVKNLKVENLSFRRPLPNGCSHQVSGELTNKIRSYFRGTSAPSFRRFQIWLSDKHRVKLMDGSVSCRLSSTVQLKNKSELPYFRKMLNSGGNKNVFR